MPNVNPKKQKESLDKFLGEEVFEDTWPNPLDRVIHSLRLIKDNARCDILESYKLKKTAKAKP